MSNAEAWRPIDGYESAYSVSSRGRVKSLPRKIIRSDGQTKTIAGRILKPRKGTQGYLRVQLSQQNKPVDRYIHRLVARTFIRPPAEDEEVNHIDGDKENNCVENLEWATRRTNVDHATDTGLNPQGSQKHGSKLTEEDIREIRRRCEQAGETHQSLADDFGVSRSLVTGIVNHTRWKHVS